MRRPAVFTTPIATYGFALIVTAVATVASLPFPSFFAQNPFAPFYLAAAVAAWYGGFGAGLLSVLGGALAADYFFLPPRHRFDLDSPGTLLRVLLFIAVAGIITGLIVTAQRRHATTIPNRDEQDGATPAERSVADRGLPLRLLDLRTHLTVATLAAAQLRRRHVSTIEAARLCVYVIRAHAQMLDDIKALEDELGEETPPRDPPL